MTEASNQKAALPGFDWPGLMRAGIGGLRLTPREFWALTPMELRLMLDPREGSRPLARHRLNDLMRAFPDRMRQTQPQATETQSDGGPRP